MVISSSVKDVNITLPHATLKNTNSVKLGLSGNNGLASFAFPDFTPL